MVQALWERIQGRYRRTLSDTRYRRPVTMRNAAPVVSFTFDDFPESALDVGGAILRAHGAVGTYYAALGLLGRDEAVGRICSSAQLAQVLAQGHELGCHTFHHSDAWETPSRAFEESILENRRALRRILPGATFETMSYPINSPRPDTKRRTARHFSACRGGGQRFNVRTVDVSYLRAFFLEQARDRPAVIQEIIDRNRAENGWLIFATHDVIPRPTRYGCTAGLFETVVRWAVDSGAKILPVARALAEVRGAPALAAGRP